VPVTGVTPSLQTERTAKVGYEGVEAADFDESLVVAFERVAVTFPTRIALGSDVWEPTYRGLDQTANRLAHRLAADGSEFERRVAILMSPAPKAAAVP
jgi:non-ribosomal peptide synthetase component F